MSLKIPHPLQSALLTLHHIDISSRHLVSDIARALQLIQLTNQERARGLDLLIQPALAYEDMFMLDSCFQVRMAAD